MLMKEITKDSCGVFLASPAVTAVKATNCLWWADY